MSTLPEAFKHDHEQAESVLFHSRAIANLSFNLEPSRPSVGESADKLYLSAEQDHRSTSPVLPPLEMPVPNLDLDLTTILGSETKAEVEKVQKRASNVLKLSQENEKLKAELRAMTDRLEAAERRREELARKQQMLMEAPSS
ncbi:hypothetical protein H0H81_001143 [Sphagnurus paluster]|uniref:Uncharacterized protein n=1 Tax=Sphagnurus paluster TaxID=117069 RepID=A0A9P7GWV5_9AGAR|nr:hypothetical protein H0H81_001143 [Sphagnurus paluster]